MFLYTAGYEQRTIDEFIERLKRNQIKVLVDVRELPISRKKGFSKSRFRERLESESIEYVHMRSLGSPRNIRHELRETKNYKEFFQRYRDYLIEQREALVQLVQIAEEKTVCIMCYEQEPDKCHRSVIIEELSERNRMEVRHI